MISQIFKWSLLLGLWKKYGTAIKALPFVLLLLLLVYALHGDYVEYAEVSEQKQHLALSFLIKWCAVFFVGLAYWLYVKSVLSPKKKDTVQKAASAKPGFSNRKEPHGTYAAKEDKEFSATDPFEKIRRKNHLRSKAEVVINNKRSKS